MHALYPMLWAIPMPNTSPAHHLPFPEQGASSPLDTSGALIHPWERWPQEPDKAYACFRAYLEQAYPDGYGGKYVVRNRAELERSAKLLPHSLDYWANVYSWNARVGHWDREVDRRKREAGLGQIEVIRKNQMRIAQKARNLGEAELDKYLSMSGKGAAPILTAKESLALMDWGAKLERGLGDALTGSDLAGTNNAGVDISTLELEDLEKLHAIFQKAKK